jgi:arylsulfatase A-like enzyme
MRYALTNEKKHTVAVLIAASTVVGFLIGTAAALMSIVSNRYISYGMFRLVALDLQRYANKFILLYFVLGIIISLLAVFAEQIRRAKILTACEACIPFFLCAGWVVNRYWLPYRFHPVSLLCDAGILLLTFFLGVAIVKAPGRGTGARYIRSAATFLLGFLVLLNGGIIVDNRARVPEGPNIVWILIDALRADHLGCYGYEKDTSPFMDAFARENIRFTYALSQESYTHASVPSYFTSTYPLFNKVLYDYPVYDVLDSRFVTVAEALRNANYNTAAFVFNPHLKAKFNYGQGFDLYDDHDQGFDTSLPPNETYETAGKIYKKTERYLARHSQRPVFLYLHYRDVHEPYVPPPPYHALFLPPDITPVIDMVSGMRRKKEDVALHMSQYDGEIRYTDDYLKKTLAMLERYGIRAENSIILITADHGEEFMDYHPGDPGGWTHGRTLYSEQTRVPLIISLPDARYKKQVIDTPVELVDVVPTLLDLLGMEYEAYNQFQGRSLLPLLEKRAIGDDAVAIRGSGIIPAAYSGGNHGRGMVMKGGYAYYFYDTGSKEEEFYVHERPGSQYRYIYEEELYHIAADPHETRNVIDEEKDVALELRREMQRRQEMCVSGMPAASGTIDRQTREQLKSLGYLQ